MSEDGRPRRFVILDFRRVMDVDSSVVTNLLKLRNRCEAQGTVLLFAEASERVLDRMYKGGLPSSSEGGVRYFNSFDGGLEWCEEKLLGSEQELEIDLLSYLSKLGVPAEHVGQVAACFFEQEIKEGEFLCRRGDESTTVFLVGSGRIRASLQKADGSSLRLRSMVSGAFVGEAAFFSGGGRTADLVAERDSRLFSLSHDTLVSLENPELVRLLYGIVGRSLASKLGPANTLLEAATGEHKDAANLLR